MIFNFGSINIDHVYRVPSLPEPGETLTAHSLETFLGGKGINQSIAIAKAKGRVVHIGAVGPDGDWAIEQIERNGVSADAISRVDAPTGNAVINVDDSAENSIVILSGANACLQQSQIASALQHNGLEDWVLVQNETNLVPEIVFSAKQAGFKVAYSAAPFVAETTTALLDQVDLLVVNEGEADALAATLAINTDDIPVPQVLITRGANGAILRDLSGVYEQSAFKVDAVDTTGAGDTFLGSFLARVDLGEPAQEALLYASAASALQVTKAGAANAIPDQKDVLEFLEKQ